MAHAIAVKHGGASHTHASTVDTSQYTQAGSEKGGGGDTGRRLELTQSTAESGGVG